MMLAHFGETAAAAAVERAIAEVLAEGGTRTPDLGGNAGTKDLGAAITAAILVIIRTGWSLPAAASETLAVPSPHNPSTINATATPVKWKP